MQVLRNLSVSALGYANLELSFVTLRDSHHILSLDQPGPDGGAGEVLTFTEAMLLNSTLRYFGDVSGDLGMTYGLTQNGSRAVGTAFLAADPRAYVPEYVYRPAGYSHQFGWYAWVPLSAFGRLQLPNLVAYSCLGAPRIYSWAQIASLISTHGLRLPPSSVLMRSDCLPHQYSWARIASLIRYGAFPQEWGNSTHGFTHLENSYVQYLYNVQVGSSNVSNCTFDGWFDEANPAFAPWAANSTALPPAVEFYNMETLRERASLTKLDHLEAREGRPVGKSRGANGTARGPTAVATAEAPRLHPWRLVSHLHPWRLVSQRRSFRRRLERRAERHLSERRAERSAEGLAYGCNVSDSLILYAWDVDLLRSSVSRSTFRWSAEGLPFPSSWAEAPPVNPSFWVDLRTHEPSSGFMQSLNDSLVCLRPKVDGADEQNATVEKGTGVFSTPIEHVGEPLCTSTRTLQHSEERAQQRVDSAV